MFKVQIPESIDRSQVNMDVPNLDSRNHQSDLRRLERRLNRPGDLSGDGHHVREKLGLQVDPVVHLPAGYDQRVAGTQRSAGEETYGLLIAPYEARR